MRGCRGAVEGRPSGLAACAAFQPVGGLEEGGGWGCDLCVGLARERAGPAMASPAAVCRLPAWPTAAKGSTPQPIPPTAARPQHRHLAVAVHLPTPPTHPPPTCPLTQAHSSLKKGCMVAGIWPPLHSDTAVAPTPNPYQPATHTGA